MSTPLKLLLPMLIMAIQAVTGTDGLKLRACHGSLGFTGEHSHACSGHGIEACADGGHGAPEAAHAGKDLQAPTECPSEGPHEQGPDGPGITAPSESCVPFVVLGSRSDVPSTDPTPLAPPAPWAAVAFVGGHRARGTERLADSPRGPPDGRPRNSAERAGALPLRL